MPEPSPSRELLAALGELVVAFSQLEASLHDSIWFLSGSSDQSATILTHGMSYRVLIDKFCALYSIRWPGSPDAKAILDFGGTLGALGEERNTMIHSFWLVDHSSGYNQRVRRSVHRLRGLSDKVTNVTPEQIAALTDRIEQADNKLIEFVMRFLRQAGQGTAVIHL